jgi:hypothetical protein
MIMKINNQNRVIRSLTCLSLLALASTAPAVVIDFTGGTATLNDATTQTTNGTTNWSDVDFYEEGGFRLDFIGGAGVPFSANVGIYYGGANDVIHAHWATGAYGTITAIDITKIGGGTFDLNYFILTSNTDTGGSFASGNEKAWVRPLDGSNVPLGPDVMLPAEDWGFPATQVFLGSDFDAVTTARFFVTNTVDCFGMDEFYIDEAAPPPVPDGGTTASLLGVALFGTVALRRKLKRA